MYKILKTWANRWFADEQAMLLLVILVLSALVIGFLGNTLMPVFISIVLAYLTFGLVQWLEHFGVRHLLAVWGIYSVFILGLILLVFVLVPMALRQGINFLIELPNIAAQLRQALLKLPEQYPNIVNPEVTKGIVDSLTTELASLGHTLIGYSLSSIGQSITLIIYLILVPILVFFFLKDGKKIKQYLQRFLPEKRQLLSNVWAEMDSQLTNYIRGKVIEISIVGVCSYILFAVMGLDYSVLLAMMVGVSVIIPYVGAVLVTIPVAIVGYAQWGIGTELYTLMGLYFILQALDGNVLVPLLFSEAVNLHPVAIITAVLVFGGLWGFWGVFFAIPLATLIKAIMRAWPDPKQISQSSS